MDAADNFGQMHGIPHLQEHVTHKHVHVITTLWWRING